RGRIVPLRPAARGRPRACDRRGRARADPARAAETFAWGARSAMKRRDPARRASSALDAFLSVETAGSLVLFAATALALVWENSAWHASYEHLWETRLAHIGVLVDLDVSVHFLVNEVLMTLFFFVVGLEIRREAHDGALASLKLAALPVAA